jgi:osmotically-inducible protein OsmY
MRKPRPLLGGIAAVLLSTLTIACSSTPTSESTGQYVDDSVISNKVRAAIIKDSELSIFQIDVTTYKGIVQLSGFVDTPEQKQHAAEVARQINGVQEVKNNLVVKPKSRG